MSGLRTHVGWVMLSLLLVPALNGPAFAGDEVPDGYSIVDGVLVPGEGPAAVEPVAPLASAAALASVGAAVIDFDNVAAPCLFINAVRLTTEYAALGGLVGTARAAEDPEAS